MTDTDKYAGYDSEGRMKIFDLEPGEPLPEGYSNTPPPGTHPNVPKRTVNESPPWEEPREDTEATELPRVLKLKARKAKPYVHDPENPR